MKYLYSIATGHVTCREGEIDGLYFVLNEPKNKLDNRICIDKREGKVYFQMLWLSERDDDRAVEIFREHLKEKMLGCYEKYKYYRNICDAITDAPVK